MQPEIFGEYQWFLDHVANSFPNDQKSQYLLLDYMAQLIQHPNVKIHFVLLIQSIEGAGKGALGRILRKIIGARNCVEPTSDEFTSIYTGWQEGAQLAIVNELMVEAKARSHGSAEGTDHRRHASHSQKVRATRSRSRIT